MMTAVARVNRGRGGDGEGGGRGARRLGRGRRRRGGREFVEEVTVEERAEAKSTMEAMQRERELDVRSEDEGELMVTDRGRLLLSAEIRARVREAFGVEEPARRGRRRRLKEVAAADEAVKSGGRGGIDPAMAVAIARRRRATGWGVGGREHGHGHEGRKASLGHRIRFSPY